MGKSRSRFRAAFAGIAAAVAVVLTVTVINPLAAAAAEDLVFALIEIDKSATPVPPDAAIPGEQVTFSIDVSCSSTQTDCISMKLTDAMPAPLQLVSVSPSLKYTTAITGNQFVLTFNTPLDEGGIGLEAGVLVPVEVIAMVPLNVDASWDDQTVVNTAFVTVDNPDSNVQDDAAVLLDIPLVLASTIDKTITPALPTTVPGLPGNVVDFNVSATNTSNATVDTLIIQDPAEPASNAFDYVEVTGLTNVVMPSGADRVQFDWFDGTTWFIGTPAATVTLPPTPALIKGVRLTFSSSTATKIAVGATGSFRLTTQTTSAVLGLVGDFTGTNLASSQVTKGVASNTAVLDQAQFTIRAAAIAPGATKTIVPGTVIGGQPVTVTVGGSNGGDFSLTSMTLTEPKTGTTSLAAQGLAFQSWTGAIEWPNGANAASVRYLYQVAGLSAPMPTIAVDTLPAPPVLPGDTVRGFIVTFTGLMPPGNYAVLPYNASTETVPSGDITTTNTITVDVQTQSGATASADASDDLTRRSTRVNTTVRKVITPDTIWAMPGASTLLSLPAEVSPLPPAVPSSTVGATSLVVRDDDVDFWAEFDAKYIVATDVPDTSTLTVRYWNGSSWIIVPGASNIVGPAVLNQALPAGVQGLEFTFVPTTPGGLLPPGFNVQPNIRLNLKNPVPNAPVGSNVTFNNTVVSEVTNPVATPPFASATANDDVTLMPLPTTLTGLNLDGSENGGPPLIDKAWQVDEVLARSNDQARLTLSWGTGGVQYPSVMVRDSAIDPADVGWNVADTVFEAFDLRSIPAITAGMDSSLTYDAIQSVELYRAGTWTATTTNPCAANACYGTFPGYTLTAAERANTVGVRFVFVERPNRVGPTVSDPSAPVIGSGVAPSVFTDRDIDLVFEVRDLRRSDGTAVLGVTRQALYNTGQFGEVLNDAYMEVRNASGVRVDWDTAFDTILILDRPITVAATKSWVDGPLGVPPVGTPQAFFPSARMTVSGENTSVAKVNELALVEPTVGTHPFDYVNISDLVSITVPAGATSSTVILTRGVVTTSYSIAAALALSEAALADVTGFEVIHTGRIDSAATTTVTLDTRLREFIRNTVTRVSDANSPVDNTVTARVVDPGGTTIPVVGTDNTVIDTASDDVLIANLNYGVVATKSIEADTVANVGSPAIQYDESSVDAKITLTGQPSGNVRTTKMVFVDTTASFWNAFNFKQFGPADAGPVSPAEQVQVDALVGVDYTVSPDGNTITTTCAGDPDLTACWVLGTPAATLTLPTLGATPISDIRGLRFTYTKIDQSNWEHPFNPIQSVVFTVSRRDTLIEKRPSAPTNEVPSTLFGFDPPPGETASGTYTNEVFVTASGGPTSDTSPLWSATDDDSKQILYQHLPARVEIKKTPVGAQTLGVDIPYQISVINRGGAHEKDLGNVVVVDSFPVDAQGAMLVIPNDPDTGVPFPVASAFTYTLKNASGVVQPAPTVTAVMSPAVIPEQTITFSLVSPSTLLKGWTLTINATLQLRPQLPTGVDVVNTATVTADQIFDSCDSFSEVSIQKPQENFVFPCTTDTRVWALPSAPMTIVKGVRGVQAGPLDAAGVPLEESPGVQFDDLGILKTVPSSIVDCSAPNVATLATAEYYRFPCVPITRPGGVEEWVNTFTNGGNIDVSRISAIDVLPRANDRGVIVNEARGSKWTPTLSTLPVLVGGPADAILDVYYVTTTGVATTRCNATDIQSSLGMTAVSNPAVTTPSCLTGAAPDDLPQRNWQLLTQAAIDGDATLLGKIVALKFVVNSATGLVPGQKISILYRSITAAAPEIAESATGLDRDSIAYNSIAAAALGDDNGIPTANRFVIEPRKVGVGMATGGVELEKIVDGANAGATYLQNDFSISLSCTSVGQAFDLKNSNGTLRNPFTITRGVTPTLILGLPLYAKCSATEANYGSVQTITPTAPSVLTAQAAHMSNYLVYNPNPAFDNGAIVSRPPIERATVTNTYNLASLVVGKTVGTNAAVDASGNPIVYSNFRFTVVCTFFNGVSTVTVLNQPAFSLNNGQTQTFAGLPAGASCVVTETTTRSPLSTTHVDNAGGIVTGPTSGTVSTIVLAADGPLAAPTNSVQFTNNFGVGSLTINKLFSGLGEADYANATFTVNISCTRNTNGGTVNVWNGTRTFSKATVLTATINNIATGAVCTITESGQGGATSVVLPSNATIGNGTIVSRNVTNVFDYAQLRVSKNVITSAADADDAVVLLDSPFQISVACTFLGSPVFAAEPMSFTLNHSDSVLLTELPSGAQCTVTEVAPGNALSTNIGVVTTAGSTANPGTTATFTLTRDTNAGVGTNQATVNNLYGVSSLTLTKDLNGGGAAQFGVGPFIIHVSCVAPGNVSSYEGDVSLTPTTLSVTIQNIAKDSVCSVAETNFASTGANHLVYRDGLNAVFDGTGVNVTDDVPSVTIENWYLTGSITVDKAVGGSAGTTFGSGPFEVTLECVRDTIDVTIANATRAIVPGTPETFEFLPDGAVCTLSESDTGGASVSVITRDGDIFPVDAATGYTFTVDNIDDNNLTDNQVQAGFDVQNDFEFAELSITKTVESGAVDQDGTPIHYGPFPVSVDCVFNGNDVYAAGYDALTPMQRDLESGDTWLLESLPQGADCTVVETDSLSAVNPSIITVEGSAAAVTTAGDTATLTLAGLPESNSAEITNPFEVGSIELSKALAGAGASDWGTEPFTINVSCLLEDGTGPRTVWDQDYVFQVVSGVMTPALVSIDNIAADAMCDITETKTAAATSTEIAIDATVTPGTTASLVVPASVDPVVVVVTNTFDLSEINVSKVRDGLGAALYGEGPFQVSLTCERDVDGIMVNVPIPGGATRDLLAETLPVAFTASYTGLPTGAECTMTETLVGGAEASVVAPGSFTLGAIATDVTITNTFGDPSVFVRKALVGDGVAIYGAGPFEVTLECTREVNGATVPVTIPGGSTRILSGANGYENSFDELPSSASCELTETTTGGGAVNITDPIFVLGTQSTVHDVDLDNTFELAQLTLTKGVIGTAASAHASQQFEVELECVIDAPEGEIAVDIPGGAVRTVSAGKDVLYEDLPADADCVITETKDGGATAMSLSYDGLPVLGSSFRLVSGDSQLSMTNVFTLALTGLDVIGWMMAGGLLLAGGTLLIVTGKGRRRRVS